MLNTPFPDWPCFTAEEADAVARVVRSNRVNYWTGTEGRAFEQEFAAWVGTRYGIALNNGSVALDLAVRALGIGPGDEVVVTPRSFIASVACVVLAGGTPVFADVDRDTQNITPETIARVLTPRTRAIIPVHLAGMPCEMDGIMALARDHRLAVIEDCAQAHGACYRGRMVGTFGDIGAWSFCQDKIMTTAGEGGAVTTSNEALWSAMWSFKDHGKSWARLQQRNDAPGFPWVHDSFGTNGRMLEVQAAVGRIQLGRMTDWIRARRQNATRIWSAAREIAGLRAPSFPDHVEHAAYKAYVFVEPAALRPDWNRDRILVEIRQRGVPCYGGSCSEIYRERAFAGMASVPREPLPNAHELGQTSLMFLVHPTLAREHIDKTCTVLRDVMRAAVR